VYEPVVFVHSTSGSQASVPMRHSLTSVQPFAPTPPPL
jgi:hypothetical protein